jgi:ABC-type spermidine/putrescine transport system permease subunit II
VPWGESLGKGDWEGWGDNLTLKNYLFVLFNYEAGVLSIQNSLVSSGLAASLGVVLAEGAAYLAERKLVHFGSLLAFLAMVPLVIPGMVFAVGLFAAYSTGPVVLFGTLWILVLAYLTKHLPFAFMSCKAALTSVHLELENAASILGASRLRVLRDITGPLIKHGILARWILVFIPSLKELSSSVLLYNSKTTVIPTAIMDAYLLPQWEAVAALSVLLLVINAVVSVVGCRFLRGNIEGDIMTQYSLCISYYARKAVTWSRELPVEWCLPRHGASGRKRPVSDSHQKGALLAGNVRWPCCTRPWRTPVPAMGDCAGWLASQVSARHGRCTSWRPMPGSTASRCSSGAAMKEKAHHRSGHGDRSSAPISRTVIRRRSGQRWVQGLPLLPR